MERVLVAMSGGVDSTIAAKLLIDSGYYVEGACMKLSSKPYAIETVNEAANVAKQLGIKFHVFDFTSDFDNKVIKYFVNSYLTGYTPNPCVRCNKLIKFGAFLDMAKYLGFEKIATGHYAKLRYNEITNRYILKRSDNLKKDQSYFLYNMTQEQLKSTLFPLEKLEKETVRKIAEDNKLTNSQKKDSQDICFITDGKYVDFIKDYIGTSLPQGNFIDTDGNILGQHSGIANYTIGQRKGVKTAFNKPLYVITKNPWDNTVVMGEDELLFKTNVIAENVNFVAIESLMAPMRVTAKHRYNQKDVPATILPINDTSVMVKFDDKQRAITPGQSIVFYDNETLIGGGEIK